MPIAEEAEGLAGDQECQDAKINESFSLKELEMVLADISIYAGMSSCAILRINDQRQSIGPVVQMLKFCVNLCDPDVVIKNIIYNS